MSLFEKVFDYGKQEPLVKLYKSFGKMKVQNAFEIASVRLCKKYILSVEDIDKELYFLLNEEYDEFIDYFSKELNIKLKLSSEICQSMLTETAIERIKNLYVKEETEFN